MKMKILYFDDKCTFCSRWVLKIVRTIPSEKLSVDSLNNLDKEIPQTNKFEGIVLFTGKAWLRNSDAALALFNLSNGIWKIVAVIGFIVPRFFRELVYRSISKNRFLFSGKSRCVLPSELKARMVIHSGQGMKTESASTEIFKGKPL
jgi:predicted DCC family thiol-disulfide oxidoreductase YuxK